MTDFDDFLASLNPDIRKRAQIASDLTDERLVTPSIGITKALDGGWRYGTQNMIWGNRSGGKTMMVLLAIAQAQRDGKVCAFVDAEGSYTPDWGTTLGIDNNKLLVLDRQKTIGGITDAVIDYMKAGVDVVGIDSIGAMIPGSYFEKTGDLKGLDNTNQIGQVARELGKMSTMFNMMNDKTLILLISQVTMNLGSQNAFQEPQGGKKVGHINNSSVLLTGSMNKDNAIMGKVSEGDREYEQQIGRPVNWKVDKSRGPGMGLTGEYDMYYAGDYIGIDQLSEVVKYGVKFGLIDQASSWFNFDGQKFQGARNLVKHLRENPEVAERLKKEIIS